MLKILHARLQHYANQELPDVQAGFRKEEELEIKLPTFAGLKRNQGNFRENIYLCFIDYVKVFDCANYDKLWKALRQMGISDHLTCLLRNLYVSQESTVRTLYGTTDWFKIEKVQQGCLSTL